MSEAKPKVAIIDYGMGNLFSVKRACEQSGVDVFVTANRSDLSRADAAILPGVGAFGDAMNNLRELDLAAPIKDFIRSGKPFMGICLGMQLLMSESEEFGRHQGLDIIKGKVVKFRSDNGNKCKIPQVGWNRIKKNTNKDWGDFNLKGLQDQVYMYFVHSFYVIPESGDLMLSTTNYEGIEYCSSFQRDNIFACQFHPEKSAEQGLMIYWNFTRTIQRERSEKSGKED